MGMNGTQNYKEYFCSFVVVTDKCSEPAILFPSCLKYPFIVK